MNPSIRNRLAVLVERHEEIMGLLGDKAVIKNQAQFRQLSKEYAQLEVIVQRFRQYQMTQNTLSQAEKFLTDSDLELRKLAYEEIEQTRKRQTELEAELGFLLLPKDPKDHSNVYLEIRAAAGGDEAAIFSGDLYRMYCRYAEKQGWSIEIVNASLGEHGGYKEIIARIAGVDVYSQLKFESGAHRVQRVPETEAQGRVHTSTCTVAVLPEVKETEAITINPVDLKIDSFRSSGAGGQHVQKTDSAVRITHLPSGLVVECQDERSQHKNRARAMSLLQSKLLAAERAEQQREKAQIRRSLVGSGERSERIRTYNFPQGRLTDHRINLTLYQLSDIIEGHLELVIQPLIREYQSDELAALGGD